MAKQAVLQALEESGEIDDDPKWQAMRLNELAMKLAAVDPAPGPGPAAVQILHSSATQSSWAAKLLQSDLPDRVAAGDSDAAGEVAERWEQHKDGAGHKLRVAGTKKKLLELKKVERLTLSDPRFNRQVSYGILVMAY